MTSDLPAHRSTLPQRPHHIRRERPHKKDVHGWLILDKDFGLTSTHAVAVVKRLFQARKAGHAGTLDPLASGLLPIALGEATKTVPFVMDSCKSYRFTVAWGTETSTDDREGEVIQTSDRRPSESDIRAILPSFTGTIQQIPPRFSAIKIDGNRAYDLAREGADVQLEARPVEILKLVIASHKEHETTFEADCGKGTYVRSLARDFGRKLGCYGHITALRRTRVGPFSEANAVSIAEMEKTEHPLNIYLKTVETALDGLPVYHVQPQGAQRLRKGQTIILRGTEAPLKGWAYIMSEGILLSVGVVQDGEFAPHRVFQI